MTSAVQDQCAESMFDNITWWIVGDLLKKAVRLRERPLMSAINSSVLSRAALQKAATSRSRSTITARSTRPSMTAVRVMIPPPAKGSIRCVASTLDSQARTMRYQPRFAAWIPERAALRNRRDVHCRNSGDRESRGGGHEMRSRYRSRLPKLPRPSRSHC